jgi:enoyl-CoA hydratase/carnithine racemase
MPTRTDQPRFVRVERQGEIGIVTLDRPPANALEIEATRQVHQAVTALAESPDVRGLVLTGRGECFSAGLDLKVVPGYDAAQQRQMVSALSAMIIALYTLPKPTVAAANGHAVAAGTLVTLATDYRVGPDSGARFGLTGVRVGIPYPAAAMAIITSELAPADRRYLLLTARTIDSHGAVARGILDELQPQARVLERAIEVASELAAMPGAAYARTKEQLHRDAIAAFRARTTGGDPHPESWLLA